MHADCESQQLECQMFRKGELYSTLFEEGKKVEVKGIRASGRN